jgi:hypothetical protein
MTPEQKAIIISQSALGIPGCTIAQSIGVHPSTVTRTQQQSDTRARIQAEAEAIINGGLRVSRQATLRASAEALRQYKAIANKQPYDKDLIKLGLDASKTILQVAGLTGQPSTIINTLININQDTGQADAVSLIGEFLQAKLSNIANCKEATTKCEDNSQLEHISGEITNKTTGNTQPHTPLTSQTNQVSSNPADIEVLP